jgi:hypothetical protein
MTTSVLMAPTEVGLENKTLIGASLWMRLTQRISREEEMELAVAERILDQTLGFLKALAADPAVSLSPSAMVDIGWHTFILHTRDYQEFCQEIAGRFIHHEPVDQGELDYRSSTARTVAAMEDARIPVDYPLWSTLDGAWCSGGTGSCRSLSAIWQTWCGGSWDLSSPSTRSPCSSARLCYWLTAMTASNEECLLWIQGLSAPQSGRSACARANIGIV